MKVVPYSNSATGKKEQVATMFNNISKKYDFLNHFLSLGIDIYWRKKALKNIKSDKPQFVLDVATGTGDLAIETMNMMKPSKIIGVDISEGMLDIAKEKVIKLNMDSKISFSLGDSENLPFENTKFDAITVSFGVRNFENLEKGLTEMLRVLKPSGKLVILEFSNPTNPIVKFFYSFYFRYILPTIGKLISKDNSAYTYLPESVKHFPDGERFLTIMNSLGYKNTKCETLTFGIASIYVGSK